MQNTAHATNSPSFRVDTAHENIVAKYRFSMRSTTTSADPRLFFMFRGNTSGSTNRLEVTFVKASGQIRLAQYDNGTSSNLVISSSHTINYDTDYDVQVVADGKHVEVWWGPAGGDLAKVIENDSAVVLGGQRYTFLTTTNTVVRVDNINITTPDTDRTTYTYNNGNELLTMVKDSGTTTFTYDDWGRQVSKIIGANSSVYTYRFGSMLKEINSTIPGEADLVHYTYDAFNKRREVRVTEASVVTSDQWYRYDLGFNAIARYDDGDLTDWVVGTRNQSVTYTGMTPLSEVPGSNPSSGSYRHYVHDHLGSTRALYDGSKVLLARQAYTPYGEQAASKAGVEATYSYTGKPWEEETGLYFFPYRYYSPSAARWAWRDPLGMVDGPNVYGYVTNNPLSWIDSLGLRRKCELVGDRVELSRNVDAIGEWVYGAFTPVIGWAMTYLYFSLLCGNSMMGFKDRTRKIKETIRYKQRKNCLEITPCGTVNFYTSDFYDWEHQTRWEVERRWSALVFSHRDFWVRYSDPWTNEVVDVWYMGACDRV